MLDRHKVVDFTEFTFLDQIVIISKAPSIIKHDLIFSNWISNNVWLLNCVSFIIISCLLTLIARLYAKLRHYQQNHQRNEWKSCGAIALKLYGICLKQCKTMSLKC